MATDASVLVPYRADGAWRDRAWEWNRLRWETLGVELIVTSPGPGAGAADFNHPRAINQAAEEASSDVLIVADADTGSEAEWVQEAVALVRSGAPWVLPRFYDKLTRESTELLLGESSIPPYEVEWRGDSVSWSGLVVVPREGFKAVGGYDERWIYWGGDDVAFACAMNTLWGRVQRLEGAAVHLWHSREGLDAQPQDQHELMYRYLAAEGDAAAMHELIAERP